MDVSALADTELAAEAVPQFVYNPLKLKEIRCLYVNLADGTKVGYLDLARRRPL
jgi:hypothetical protein